MINKINFIILVICIFYIYACSKAHENEINDLWLYIGHYIFKSTVWIRTTSFFNKTFENTFYNAMLSFSSILTFIPFSLFFSSILSGFIMFIPVYALWLELHVFGILIFIYVFSALLYFSTYYVGTGNLRYTFKIIMFNVCWCLSAYFILYLSVLLFGCPKEEVLSFNEFDIILPPGMGGELGRSGL